LAAPVALYPDLLLSEVLAASTYPLELAQAGQWMQGNLTLLGRDLVEAAKQQNWDPSVQALVAFPDVMNMLTRDIQWTTDLGNAFLSQQTDLMDAIQQLRASARNNGRLTDTAQQRVTYEQQSGEQQNGQNAIVIQPTDPQVVYPPVYNPEYVWGPPAYGAYPPLGYPASGYGIYYGVATFVGALFTGLLSFGGWGWGLSWLTHGLFLNGLFFSHFGFHGYSGYGFNRGYGYAARAAWVHDPGHRLGVPYGNGYASGARYGARFSPAVGGRGWGGSSYRDSGYQSGNRQMEAYRGLEASRSTGAGFNNYGSSYRTGGSGYAASRNNAGVASQGAYRGGYQGSRAAGRAESFSSPHYSAPKSSSGFGGHSHFGGGGEHFGGHTHSGGGGHSGGGHSGGGGHSHGGSHKK